MTPALHRMLTLMKEAEAREDYEDAEAVADGLQVWVGDQRFHWKRHSCRASASWRSGT
jgi:hypothetical protein